MMLKPVRQQVKDRGVTLIPMMCTAERTSAISMQNYGQERRSLGGSGMAG
jgi:hypothetical protein